MRILVAAATAAVSLWVMTGVALALPGDQAIDSQHPFRLDDRNLEPGCFEPGRGPVDLDSHLDLTFLMDGEIARELHVTVDEDSPVNVDQVLVPSRLDGYRVYNNFENTGRAVDIGPNFTAVDLFAPDSNGIDGPDPIDVRDVIVCVSDHGLPQNEPYQSEDGGLVSAKNRPIIKPLVTAIGQSPITLLKTYKLGFGYRVEQWYEAPTYDGAGTFPFHPLVSDPNAVPSPVFNILPLFVRIDPRLDDLPYDARRVNDVDQPGEDFGNPKTDYGQTRLFRATGDPTAWTSSNNNEPDTLSHLITFNAQGDLPVQWSLRPSLASPDSLRSVEFTPADFAKWDQDWQKYYCGGSLPEMPLAPGTNSPDPRPSCPAVVNPPLTLPAPTVNVPITTPTVNTTVVAPDCVGNRVVTMVFGKKTLRAKVRFNGKTIKAKRSGGKLVARVSLRGVQGQPGQYVTMVVTIKKGRRTIERVRLFKLCG